MTDKIKIEKSLHKLMTWMESNNYRGFDPFDGLSSWLNLFTFQNKKMKQLLIQGVRRAPFNIRPFIGIKPHTSTKGMGFLASGYLSLFKLYHQDVYKNKARFTLDWLIKHKSPYIHNFSWGNNFDYASRAFFLPKEYPTLVWTSLIGHAFMDAFDTLNDERYLRVAISSCEYILNDQPYSQEKNGLCLSYITGEMIRIHNSNLLGAGLLSRGYNATRNNKYKATAREAVLYSVSCQLENGAWYYGEENKYHWIDNWHTAYNLDSLYFYQLYTGDKSFEQQLYKGLDFYVDNFFCKDGAPKYYFDRVYRYDIQSASQAIDTLVLFSDLSPKTFALAMKVARWTIDSMQDRSGYFYLWKNRRVTNKTPTFYWGNATMFRALSNLLLKMEGIE